MSATTAYEQLLDALSDHGSDVKETGQGKAIAQCPAHDDRIPSLSVTRIDGQVLVYCHAGCDTEKVMQALGLTMADLYDDRRGARYEYPDGRTVLRTPDKRFTQRGNTKGRSIFHADRIGDATTVYVVEGEKDVLAVEAAGGAAVCPAMGAGKARRFDWSPLAGKYAVVVADRDESGRRHAAVVAELLDGIAASVRIMEAAVGKDVADHLSAGETLDELVPVEMPQDERPKVWKATDLRPPEQPRFLAKDRLPLSAISLLVGDEGIGKSLLWVWIVAAVTTGKPLPEFGIPARTPALVLIVVTEDNWSTDVLPRLIVAGANLDMVRVVCTDRDGSGAPVFPRDLDLIREMHEAPVLVVVDAWLDTVSPGLSVRDPQQARQALHPWREVATVTGAAVLLLTHTNRIDSGNARDRYGATGELRKKARMTLYAQLDDEGRLVVGPEKANSTGAIAASMFTVTPVKHFPATEDHDGTVPLLTYQGTSTLTARQLLADAYQADHSGGSAGDDVAAWLATLLGDGPRWATDVYDAAAAVGHSKDKAKRAKKRLCVEAIKDGTGAWFWRLPGQGSTPTPNASLPTPLLPCADAPLQRGFDQSREQGSKGATDRDAANAAYSKGLCKTCHKVPYRPGGTQCEGCYQSRNGGPMLAAYRAAGLARPPTGMACHENRGHMAVETNRPAAPR